jgi:hypothetical protein
MMKSKSFGLGVLVVALIFVLIFGACVTNGGRYDASIPVEQEAHLEILGGFVVGSFDGKQVAWIDSSIGGNMSFGNGKFIISIPAGQHSLIGQKGTQIGEITYGFIAGHTYSLKLKASTIEVTDITK